MTQQELRDKFSKCITSEYPNGWSVEPAPPMLSQVFSYDSTPLYEAGFNKTDVPIEYDDWDEAWSDGSNLLLVGWHNSQTTKEYYCQPVKKSPEHD